MAHLEIVIQAKSLESSFPLWFCILLFPNRILLLLRLGCTEFYVQRRPTLAKEKEYVGCLRPSKFSSNFAITVTASIQKQRVCFQLDDKCACSDKARNYFFV
jgi:hypothetical protein